MAQPADASAEPAPIDPPRTYTLGLALGGGGKAWDVRINGQRAGRMLLDTANDGRLPYDRRRLGVTLDLAPRFDDRAAREVLLTFAGDFAARMHLRFVEWRHKGLPIERVAGRVDLKALGVTIAHTAGQRRRLS